MRGLRGLLEMWRLKAALVIGWRCEGSWGQGGEWKSSPTKLDNGRAEFCIFKEVFSRDTLGKFLQGWGPRKLVSIQISLHTSPADFHQKLITSQIKMPGGWTKTTWQNLEIKREQTECENKGRQRGRSMETLSKHPKAKLWKLNPSWNMIWPWMSDKGGSTNVEAMQEKCGTNDSWFGYSVK